METPDPIAVKLPSAAEVWANVKPGDSFEPVRRTMQKSQSIAPELQIGKRNDNEAILLIKDFLVSNPIVETFDGKRVLLANGDRGDFDPLFNRAEHLAGRKGTRMRGRNFIHAKAIWVAAMPETLKYASVKVRQSGDVLYFKKYKDGRVHMVLLSPEAGIDPKFGAYDYRLITQYALEPINKFEGGVVLAKG